jgi:parvulin-like peptidyl-prolyl isomerase
MSVKRLAAAVLALALVAAACSSPPDILATIDGIDITRARFEAMHPDGTELAADEQASTLLLLMIHDAFFAAAESELGITPDAAALDDAFAARTESAVSLGDVDEILANRGVTRERVKLESDLDALRLAVGPALVLAEADGFDLDLAYEEFLKDEARVCVKHILLFDTENIESILDRISDGEPFEEVARELSEDNLAQRPAGESGAGGDMGCSYPNSFNLAIASAAIDLDIPVGEVFGPVLSDQGLHVLQVYERELPELADVRAQVIESAVDDQSEAVFTIWAIGVLQRARVTIDDGYGRWGPREGTNGIPTVIPPGEE